jgi:acyl-CoA thioester hydrolase
MEASPRSAGSLSSTIRRRIEWADTDASGHYHYATAARLFEAAESELLERLGLLDEIYGRLPRVHVTFDYRRILFFRDVIDVVVSIVGLGRSSITYALEVTKDGEACIEGSVVATLIDDSGRSTPWPERHRAVLSPGGG